MQVLNSAQHLFLGAFVLSDAVVNLKQFTVWSSFKHNIPKSLIISSSSLEVGKTVGQGDLRAYSGIKYKLHLVRKDIICMHIRFSHSIHHSYNRSLL